VAAALDEVSIEVDELVTGPDVKLVGGVLLLELVETMLESLNILDILLPVDEMLLELEARDESRYISSLFPAPQYS
jgi:hypothetical protein